MVQLLNHFVARQRNFKGQVLNPLKFQPLFHFILLRNNSFLLAANSLSLMLYNFLLRI
jgi:hypothetical protein